jgi:hypothetical protein
LPAAIAALACSENVVLTAKCCWQVRKETILLTGVLAVITGVAWLCWEMARLTFASRGVRYLASGRPTLSLAGLGLWSRSVVPVASSGAASLGYLVKRDGRRREAVLHRSTRYRERRARLVELGRERTVMAQAAEAGTARSYPRRALETPATARELQSERDQVRQALASMTGRPTAPVALGQISEAGVLAALARLLHLDVSCVRVVAYGVAALMLELISTAALLLATGHGQLPTDAWPEPSRTAQPAAAMQNDAEVRTPRAVPSPPQPGQRRDGARERLARPQCAQDPDTEGYCLTSPRVRPIVRLRVSRPSTETHQSVWG